MLRPYTPATHVPHVVDGNLIQSRLTKHFRNPRAAGCLRTRRCRDCGQRGLTRERRLIRALDVQSRRADAIVGEEGVNHECKL
jgi:hypothetical protein